MESTFIFQTFDREDFPAYQSWFEDETLNGELGPMHKDDAWLNAVLAKTNGLEYAVYEGDELVAVVGIDFPTNKYPAYYITNFAVKPALKNQGVGSAVLKELIRLHASDVEEPWITFVNPKNVAGQSFFIKNGWTCANGKPDKDGILEYVFRQSAMASANED